MLYTEKRAEIKISIRPSSKNLFLWKTKLLTDSTVKVLPLYLNRTQNCVKVLVLFLMKLEMYLQAFNIEYETGKKHDP